MDSYSPNYLMIQDAIEFKQQVIGSYNGYRLEMCPHALGFADGRERAVCYQFGGDSVQQELSMDPMEKWICVPLDDLVIHDVRDGQWYTGAYPVYYQTCVHTLTFEVV